MQVYNIPSCLEVRFVNQAGGCERPHTHDHIIISSVIEGQISFLINKRKYILKKGVTLVLGPNILHNVDCYSHDFKGIYVLELFSLMESYKEYSPMNLMLNEYLVIEKLDVFESFTYLCEILLTSLEDNKKMELSGQWLKNHILRYINSQKANRLESNDPAGKIKRLLDEHQGEKAPFEAISILCNKSKESCNRLFKQSYNISIQAYFLNKKAFLAKELLKSTKSISEIALECGFYDQSHFNHIFKKIFQLSPAKYRSQFF